MNQPYRTMGTLIGIAAIASMAYSCIKSKENAQPPKPVTLGEMRKLETPHSFTISNWWSKEGFPADITTATDLYSVMNGNAMPVAGKTTILSDINKDGKVAGWSLDDLEPLSQAETSDIERRLETYNKERLDDYHKTRQMIDEMTRRW